MDDNDRWDAVDEATELLRERDLDGAEREINGVLDRDPNNQYAWHFLGALHFERNEFDKARAAYSEALKNAPGYRGSALGLGHSLRMLKRYDDAIRAGERALTMARDRDAGEDGDAHYLLGLTYAAKGDVVRAIRHVEAFLANNPELEARGDAKALLETLLGRAKPLKLVD